MFQQFWSVKFWENFWGPEIAGFTLCEHCRGKGPLMCPQRIIILCGHINNHMSSLWRQHQMVLSAFDVQTKEIVNHDVEKSCRTSKTLWYCLDSATYGFWQFHCLHIKGSLMLPQRGAHQRPFAVASIVWTCGCWQSFVATLKVLHGTSRLLMLPHSAAQQRPFDVASILQTCGYWQSFLGISKTLVKMLPP